MVGNRANVWRWGTSPPPRGEGLGVGGGASLAPHPGPPHEGEGGDGFVGVRWVFGGAGGVKPALRVVTDGEVPGHAPAYGCVISRTVRAGWWCFAEMVVRASTHPTAFHPSPAPTHTAPPAARRVSGPCS